MGPRLHPAAFLQSSRQSNLLNSPHDSLICILHVNPIFIQLNSRQDNQQSHRQRSQVVIHLNLRRNLPFDLAVYHPARHHFDQQFSLIMSHPGILRFDHLSNQTDVRPVIRFCYQRFNGLKIPILSLQSNHSFGHLCNQIYIPLGSQNFDLPCNQ